MVKPISFDCFCMFNTYIILRGNCSVYFVEGLVQT